MATMLNVELEIKDTTDTFNPTLNLDLHLKIDNEDRLEINKGKSSIID